MPAVGAFTNLLQSLGQGGPITRRPTQDTTTQQVQGPGFQIPGSFTGGPQFLNPNIGGNEGGGGTDVPNAPTNRTPNQGVPSFSFRQGDPFRGAGSLQEMIANSQRALATALQFEGRPGFTETGGQIEGRFSPRFFQGTPFQGQSFGNRSDFLRDLITRAGGIPSLAHGGVVTAPTTALIGEAGPEAVVPLNNPMQAIVQLLAALQRQSGGSQQVGRRQSGDPEMARMQVLGRPGDAAQFNEARGESPLGERVINSLLVRAAKDPEFNLAELLQVLRAEQTPTELAAKKK